MAAIDGRWDMVVRTPLGDQRGVLTVASAGDRWSGDLSGALGSAEIPDGKVNGDTLAWKMAVTTPMTLTLDCEARVEGDRMEGTVGAGVLGSFPLSGTRA